MFKIGDRIVYGSIGVCSVEDIAPMDRGGKDYYKLKPCFGSEVVYTPVDTKVFMRPALNREEALKLISQIPNVESKKCDTKTVTAMKDEYQQFFTSHNCEDLIQLIKGIYEKGEEAGKLGVIDQRYMKKAEDLLHGELALALDIERDQVPEYIAATIEK